MGKLLIVIPTRNRAALAANALRSVLECKSEDIEVLLSDNSTAKSEAEQLATVVGEFHDARVTLCAPPTNMTMTHHWNWVLEAASDRDDLTHVLVLTDRMVFKRNGLDRLRSVVAEHSQFIISYNHDRVVDHQRPFRAELQPWSNEVLNIPSEHLLQLSADCTLPQALPRLLNCVVPVGILRALREQCGNVVASISPDHSFCYRALAMVDKIAYWDRAPIVHYALDRSNGESAARGVHTADHADFLSKLEGPIFAAAPMPGILTVANSVLHEYAVARDELQSEKFPPINERAYVAWIASELAVMENAQLAGQMRKLLAEYQATHPNSATSPPKSQSSPGLARRLARRLGVGRALLRVYQAMRRMFNRHTTTFVPTFASAAEALEYARGHDGERMPWPERLHYFAT